jgi:signal transduction histidine kinase
MEDQARKQFQRLKTQLTVTYLSGLSSRELEQRLATLPNQSIIYYLIVYQDGDGEHFNPLSYLERLSAVANRPIYSWVDSTLDRGVVGGNMQSQLARINSLAELALRVLGGEQADSIPISVADASVNQVDWRQIQRWGIPASNIPAGTQILFREPALWEQYKGYILVGAVLLTAQTVLIAGLLIQAARRRRAEEQVSRSQTELRGSYERIRDLGGRLLGAQETERSRIARWLHDDLGQQAALLSIDLQLLSNIDPDRAEDSRKLTTSALDRTQNIARSVHDLSHSLHPAKLRLIGLVASLSSLRRDFSHSDIEITFSHHDVPHQLPYDLQLCLFRITQEALQNAVKHSQARTVSVNLTGTHNELILVIEDDGVGFDPARTSSSGLGLLSMRERLEPLNGVLTIDSKPGAGARIEAAVSIPRADSA